MDKRPVLRIQDKDRCILPGSKLYSLERYGIFNESELSPFMVGRQEEGFFLSKRARIAFSGDETGIDVNHGHHELTFSFVGLLILSGEARLVNVCGR